MGLEDRFNADDNLRDYTLPSHQFCYLLREYARGEVTLGEARDIMNGWLTSSPAGTVLTAQEESDLVAIAGLIDAEGPQLMPKLNVAIMVGDVIGLSETGSLGYQTRAELKTRIGF